NFLTLLVQLRKVVTLTQGMTLLAIPMVHKELLAFGHRGSLNLHVGVAPRIEARTREILMLMLVMGRNRARIHVGEIYSTKNRGFAIDNHQLAMVAVSGGPPVKTPRRRARWIELEHTDTAFAHPIEKFPGRGHRTEAVINHIDLDASALLGN